VEQRVVVIAAVNGVEKGVARAAAVGAAIFRVVFVRVAVVEQYL
jgi:hypothetical protein